MNNINQYIIFQALIILPFISGFFSKGFFKDASHASALSGKLVSFNLVLLEPPVVFWSIWGLALYGRLVYLPAGGLLLVAAGLLTGMAAACFMKLKSGRRASYIISSSLANHGYTMGGFVCFLLFGEQGLALAFIFISYFMAYLFLVIFPYARLASGREIKGSMFSEFFINIRNMPFYALIIAVLLNAGGIKRPDVWFPVNIFLMASVALYYYALGLNFNAGKLRESVTENVSLALSKFVVLPLAVYIVILLFNAKSIESSVILAQSFMPAAIYSVVTSVFFNLDTELASSLFVVNTLVFILLVLPVLLLFGKYIFAF